MGRAGSWLEFWEDPPAAFGPNERNEAEARQVAQGVIELLGLRPGDRLLDWGCGYALGAGVYREAGVELFLYDRSSHFQERVEGVLDEERVAGLDAGSFDAIVIYSVIQYLDDAELEGLLGTAGRLLAPEGALVLGDVIPPETRLRSDLRAFLPRSLRPARVLARVRGGLALALDGDYGHLRRSRGLHRLDAAAGRRLLAQHGLGLNEARRNVGPNPSRRTWVCRPTGRRER